MSEAVNSRHEPQRGGLVLAGVDLGTLTCRLLIARVDDGHMTELCSERRILRLGEGVATERRLRDSAMARVLDALKDWRQAIRAYGVQAEVAVATSAVRDALNQDVFLRAAKQDAGFEVEVLTGEEEARRTMLGIRSGLPPDSGDVLGLDIGGGSTELIVDRLGRPPIVRSLDLGVVRTTEQFLQHDPPTAEEIQRARLAVSTTVAARRPLLGDLTDCTLVGTAGTITTLAAMAQDLAQYVSARIHNYVLSLDRIRTLEQTLLRQRSADRRRLAGLEPGREEVIAAGTVILSGVMETLGFSECLVSDLGLREGIVLDLAARMRGGTGREARG